MSTYDIYDIEWEDPETGRTTSNASDDDFCECCLVKAGTGDCDFCAEVQAQDKRQALIDGGRTEWVEDYLDHLQSQDEVYGGVA